MQLLEEVTLSNFRGFGNYTLRLRQFDVLIGKNNSGKTSLLQAIQLVYDAMKFLFGGEEHPRFTRKSWRVDLATPISRMALSNTDLIFFKKVPEGLQISAKWDNGIQLDFNSRHDTHFDFQLLENGTSINDKLDVPRVQELIASVYSIKAVILPPVGTVSPDEQFIPYPEMERRQAEGRYNEIWRNSLRWIYNDGDKTVFDDVSAFVKTYIPGFDVLPPKDSRDSSPPKVIIEYSDGSDTYDISSSGGGLRTLISLATTLKLADASCILLDEPDAHLHSELQRQVAEMLLDHTESQNVQMVIATHSPDIIDCVPLDSLLLIDRSEKEAYPVDDVGKALMLLGNLTNSQAIAAHGAGSIINVEGNADKIVFSEFAEKLGTEFPGEPETRLTRFGKIELEKLKYMRQGMLDFLRTDIKIAQINDLDYDSIVQQSKGIKEQRGDGVLLLTLGRKEIENYLLDANAITKGAETQLSKRQQNHTKISPPSAETINDIMRESFEKYKEELSYKVKPLIRGELSKAQKKWEDSRLERETDERFECLWGDEEWRLSACPGKSVLRNIRTELQKRWGVSVSTRLLCRNMESVPKDIESILEKLRDFLTAEG